MIERDLSEEQFAALVAKVAKLVLGQMEASHSADTNDTTDRAESLVRRGRPRSIYTGQLHIKVLAEDAEWFKRTSDQLGIQRGAFLSILRKSFS